MDRLYVDLDETLVWARGPAPVPRPGALEFIRALSRHGEVWILSHGTEGHVSSVLPFLKDAVMDLLAGVLTREDLGPVIEPLDQILGFPGLSDTEFLEAWNSIAPIAPPGVVFDDQPAGSYGHLIKAAAVGIGPGDWIRVRPFHGDAEDADGLEEAYHRFHRRHVRPGGFHEGLLAEAR